MSETLRRRLDEARLALMLLTRLPVGRLKDPVPSLAEARWAYPLVGLVIGAIAWVAHHGALMLGLGPLPAALVALGAMVLVTGALHHDGLADFADGLGGGRDPDHRLEIMRDSRIGSYGALALIFDSAFTLAPAGHNPECFRLHEAVEAHLTQRLIRQVRARCGFSVRVRRWNMPSLVFE